MFSIAQMHTVNQSINVVSIADETSHFTSLHLSISHFLQSFHKLLTDEPSNDLCIALKSDSYGGKIY